MGSADSLAQCILGILTMHAMHLSSVDLNLLPVLDALLRERHVTRAARRVGLSQSAMSHALRRLREVLDDPILVRSGRTMVLTERAERLEAPLREALDALQTALGAEEAFDPATASRRFHLAAEDLASVLFLPGLLRRSRQDAPAIDFDVMPQHGAALFAGLEDKSIDLSIGVHRELPAFLRQQRLLVEDFVCVVRRGHPRIRKRLTLKQYAELPHALIGVGDRGPTRVGTALAARGLERRVALRVGSFVAAPLIVAETDLVLTLPRRLAERVVEMAPLAIHEAPIELEPFAFSAIWHERRQREPAHRYLRSMVAAVAAEL